MVNDSSSENDGIDRRGFLECMAWAGSGLLWTLSGGLPAARVFGQDATRATPNDFSFVQISDSHIGFSKEPNRDVVGTLQAVVDKINALAATTCIRPAYWRPDAPGQARGVRHRRRSAQRREGEGVVRAR